MERNCITLYQFAGFLFIVGLASAFYSAADRSVGWNAHGASGLYACGGAAVVAAILAYFTGKGKEGAAWAGLALAFLLLSYGGYKLFTIVRNVAGAAAEIQAKRPGLAQDDAERAVIYKACIFGAMTVFAIGAFLRLAVSLRQPKTA